MNITYRNILERLLEMPDADLDQTATVFNSDNDESFGVKRIKIANCVECDYLKFGQIYLEV